MQMQETQKKTMEREREKLGERGRVVTFEFTSEPHNGALHNVPQRISAVYWEHYRLHNVPQRISAVYWEHYRWMLPIQGGIALWDVVGRKSELATFIHKMSSFSLSHYPFSGPHRGKVATSLRVRIRRIPHVVGAPHVRPHAN
uniref:Uncharacterized protein n=1 Tax=Nelumbo nucifera TaxID=4432 RepID=A0A822YJ09_NELNU|nr:TPA_asm: hypothetical protein HUJ06_010954 [Nelumbo nucifera]